MAEETWDEAALCRLIEERHPAPAWAFLPGVANATGGGKSRTADALAMSLWPSRGLEIHGFEIKSYRSDWLRELKAPAKAEAVARYCHRWWVVAGPGVVDIGELPPAWGLLVVAGRKLRLARPAAERIPEAPTWAFLAAILRGAHDGWERRSAGMVDRAEVEKLAQVLAPKLAEELKTDLSVMKAKRDELQLSIEVFEAASGVRLSRWDNKKIGDAVRRVMAVGDPDRSLRESLERARDLLAGQVGRLEQQLKSLPPLPPPAAPPEVERPKLELTAEVADG